MSYYIKPCPFCGSEAKLIKREEENNYSANNSISYDVVCCNNENHSLDYYAATPEEIINIWNERNGETIKMERSLDVRDTNKDGLPKPKTFVLAYFPYLEQVENVYWPFEEEAEDKLFGQKYTFTCWYNKESDKFEDADCIYEEHPTKWAYIPTMELKELNNDPPNINYIAAVKMYLEDLTCATSIALKNMTTQNVDFDVELEKYLDFTNFKEALDFYTGLYMELLQNDGHCGDCTNVPAPCIKCHIESMQDEAREEVRKYNMGG